MNKSAKQIPPVAAETIPARVKKSLYPEVFAQRVSGRSKKQLGDYFGLKNFGVNLTRLSPGSQSALRHAHSRQDEFIYVLEGSGVLITDTGEEDVSPGMCIGFPAGTGEAHHLLNRSTTDVVFLEIGDRSPDDEVSYPDDDLKAVLENGAWKFTKKDGSGF